MKNALLRLSQAICVASTRHTGQGKGDVDITQLVDGTKGVHVMMPKAIFAF